MTFKKIICTSVISSLGALAASSAVSQEAGGRGAALSPMAQRVSEIMGAYVRPDGAWTQENEDYVEGGEQPRMWVKRYSYEMNGEIVIDRTFAVHDGDICRPMITAVYSVDNQGEGLRVTGFGRNGVYLTGHMKLLEDGASERMAVGQVAPGREIRFREINDFPDPDTSRATHFDPDGEGGWTQGDTASWIFDASVDACS